VNRSRLCVILVACLLLGAAPNRTPGVNAPGSGGSNVGTTPSTSLGLGGGTWTTVIKTADTDVTNSIALVTDADLCWPSNFGINVEIQAWVRFSGNGAPGATPGIRVNLSLPVGFGSNANFRWPLGFTYDGAGLVTAIVNNTSSTPFVDATADTLGGHQYTLAVLLSDIYSKGPLVVTTTIACLRYANKTATPGGVTRVYAGSTLSYRVMPP
jgi:hypothetical protein